MIGNAKLRRLYAAMLECRMLEERSRLPGAQARRPPDYAAVAGHEAVVVGCTIDLRKGDVALSCPAAGTEKFLREICLRCKGTGNVAVVFSAADDLRDGVWHEALSAAGAKSLPILFVGRDQLAEKTWNAKSSTRDYGFPRIPVDGHDVIAVYRVAHESIQRARSGGGATLIECLPYRLDTPGQNRRQNRRIVPPVRRADRKTEIDPVVDPIFSMELYLSQKKLFREAWKNQVVEQLSRKLNNAAQKIDPVAQQIDPRPRIR